MSIKQERMVELIKAARDYKLAFESINEKLDFLRDEIARHKIDAAQAFEIIYMHVGLRLLERPAESSSTIEHEYKHFRANFKRNKRAAIKQEEKRRAMGIRPKQYSADPFGEPSRIPSAIRSQLYPTNTSGPNLAYDEGDPENQWEQGQSFAQQPSEAELKQAHEQQSLLVPGETDEDRAARRRMVEQAMSKLREEQAKAEEERVMRSLRTRPDE